MKTIRIYLLLFILFLCTCFFASSQTVIKQLYLSSPGQILDRIDPVATGDLSTSQSSVLYGVNSFETITQVGAPVSSNAAQTVSTHSFAYNSGSTGNSRVLMVGISYLNTNNRSVSSVTYGGQAMTLVGNKDYNNGNNTYYARVYIYSLIAPLTGSNTLAVTWSGALSQGAVVGAITYSGVNQATPTGTFASSSGSSSTPSVTVTGATGRLMFGVVSGQSSSAYTVTGGGTQLWTSIPYSSNTAGASQSKAGAASVSITWSSSNARWATAGVSLIQATKPNSTSFIQTTAMCSNLIIKAGAITVTNYINILSGTMPVNPAITAVVKYGTTTIITLTNPTYNSGTGLLTWTGTLSSDVTVPSGQSVTLLVTNNQSLVDFLLEYDSQTKPSKIELPVSTYINVNSIGVYNAAYPGGSSKTTSPSGVSRYFRAVVSDPFGASDITALNFTITPTGNVVAGTLVATSGCTSTYEYLWTTPVIPGSYNINATAKEGYENTVTHSNSTIENICSICPPVAENDSATGSGGSPINIDPLANDYGINSNLDPSSLTIVTQPNNGTAYLFDGKIVYLPNGSFSGKDTVTYQICDVSSPVPLCTTAKIFVSIDPLIIDICGNTPKPHTYYIPYPEQEAYTALKASTSNSFASNNIRTVISIKVPYSGITIVWDEWEDGYEANYLNPTQSSTKVWGDGNIYNGIAPGYSTDIIPAGGNIVLDNIMPANPRNSASIFYDGKDKVIASGQVAMTQVSGEPSIISVQVIKTNITSVYDFGKSFTIPLGENFNSQDFRYTSLFIRASESNTSVNVDKDNNGTFETTAILNEGQCLFVNGGVLTGAIVTSDKPVGVELNSGGVDAYSIRNAPIFPASWYYHTYYTPVPTSSPAADNPKDTSVVMMYNSLNRAININWYSGVPSSGVITIPAKSVVRFPLVYSATAAYKFVNPTGESFTAIEIVDSYTPGGGGNLGYDYDWAFNLISEPRLTDFATIAWAPGSVDGSRNDNPIWVTPSANTTVYVKYDGEVSTGPFTSPCGLKYDISYSLNALDYVKIKDPNDKDQSGIAVYTCNGAKIAAVYGEDASTAVVASPSWDVGATIQPFCKQKLIFAIDDYAKTLVNQPVTISVLKNDGGFLAVIDPATLTTLGLLQPKYGTTSINSNGTILYTPAAGYIGIDTFEYVICSTPTPVICAKAKVIVVISGCPADNNQNVISGQVFMDRNKDGLKNDDGTGYPQIKVFLYADGNCNSIIDTKEKIDSVIVDSSGFYQFIRYPEKIIADNFDADAGGSSCATGTDGNTPWTTSWTDAIDPSTGFCNISQTAANTDAEIIYNTGFSYGLRLKDKNISATRMVNLSGVTKAFLSFSYMKKSTSLTSTDTVFVQASANGSAFTTIYTLKGDGIADNAYVPVLNQDISNYLSATTYIRFLTNNGMSDNDSVYIDDVTIKYLNYPQCYITGIDPLSVPSFAYTTTALQKSMTLNIGSTCSSQMDFGIAKNSIAINGKLYNDNNALIDAQVNGSAIGDLNGSAIYVYLSGNKGKVLNKSTVLADGTFSFPSADVSSTYKLLVSTNDVNIYDPVPTSGNIPSDWIYTGEDYGSNNLAGIGVDGGTTDGKIDVITGLSTINNIKIGFERLPDSDNKLYFISSPSLNSYLPLNGTGLMPGPLSGSDPEDGILGTAYNVDITSLPIEGNQLYYNNIRITLGKDGINPPSISNPFKILNYNPNLLSLKFTKLGSKFSEFNYAYLDAANLRKAVDATYRVEWEIPLPVKLISFTAMLKDINSAELTWVTVSEINVSHFVIERSIDGVNFIDAGIVNAYGSMNDKAYYSLIDTISSIKSTIFYYRLRSIDIDGKSQYSDIRILRVGSSTGNLMGLIIYPNPASRELKITLPDSWQNKKVVYELYNASGQIAKRMETANSSQTETLNIMSLAPGFYIMKVSCDGVTAQQKVIKN